MMKATIFFLAIALGNTVASAKTPEGVPSSDQQVPAASEDRWPIDESLPRAHTSRAIPARQAPIVPFLRPVSPPPHARAPGDYPLSFLQAQRDYLIRFREGTNIFDQGPAHIRNQSPPIPTPIVRLIEVSNGSWAKIEYPEMAADYSKWNVKRREFAELNEEHIASQRKLHENVLKIIQLKEQVVRLTFGFAQARMDHELQHLHKLSEDIAQATEENSGLRKTLKDPETKFNKLNGEIAQEIKAVQVWVNLDNAVSISELSKDLKDIPAPIGVRSYPSPEASTGSQFDELSN